MGPLGKREERLCFRLLPHASARQRQGSAL